jgi:ribosomal protein S12 methylthiotransferase accessory factor
MTPRRAVVFLGSSMRRDRARHLLDADYRAPVRRGDLDSLAPGTVVGLIDGVFEQDLAVSPREVTDALARGLVVFGGSSMGALRAAEVEGARGVGRVYEWYRDGLISRDDEVALLFHPEMMIPLTVPTVNVRFAVQRLRSMGTIDDATGAALLSSAERLHFKDRTYPRILDIAGLGCRRDRDELIAMLEAHDIKAEDAQAVLEAIDRYLQDTPRMVAGARAGRPTAGAAACSDAISPDEPAMLIWESGDRATDLELWRFLGLTGKLFGLAEGVPAPDTDGEVGEVSQDEVQRLFTEAAARWGWMSSEEAAVTLADLKLDKDVVAAACAVTALARARAQAAISSASAGFRESLRARLFVENMDLKREVMRLASLDYFAARASDVPSPAELEQARTVLCKLHGVLRFDSVRRRLEGVGLGDVARDDAVAHLARARRAARALCERMSGRAVSASKPKIGAGNLDLRPCPKPRAERRFAQPLAVAEPVAREIASRIGVTRIGMIGELGDLGTIQIAQAARPGNAWSSSYGSGKSRTRAGAVVGSIMEECEKWAQEQFAPAAEVLSGSYEALKKKAALVDPATLDLPYDTTYTPAVPLVWCAVDELMRGERAYIPVDIVDMRRHKHDICYTARGARKHLATNGLGAGFSMAEAVLHGLCELVERHAQRMAELSLFNPGGLGELPYRFVDPCSAPEDLGQIARDLASRLDCLRVLDITSEIRIPTLAVALVRDGRIANGYAAHPDPSTAMEMALLEAAQTIASAIAGGREDLSVHARSLGRHERPRPSDAASAWFWMDPDVRTVTVSDLTGTHTDDVLNDLDWCLGRLLEAGIDRVLVCDLSRAEIAPAKVVRVIIPGIETNNPFYTGPRARLTLLRDLLPRWY